MTEIIVAKSAGFCYGVNRAVEMCRKAAEQHKNCVTLGPIIHNNNVIDELRKKGVRTLSDISEVRPDDTVIIRSHGACKEEYEALTAIGANVIDATCPDVKKIHDIVRSESEAGRLITVIGERDHPEIKAICSLCKRCEVFETTEEMNLSKHKDIPVAIVFQTTSTQSTYDSFVANVKKEYTNAIIYDTVCNATKCRQIEAEEISQNADSVIIVGDYQSSNSLKLAEICKKHCKSVFFVQSADDIRSAMFSNMRVVGVTAGASTPAFIVKEVIGRMKVESAEMKEKNEDGITVNQEAVSEDIAPESLPVSEDTVPPLAQEVLPVPKDTADPLPAKEEASDDIAESLPVSEDALLPAAKEEASPPADDEASPLEQEEAAEESFDEMLEKSIKTFRTGDKVSCYVTTITATEIAVDLGAKQSGYIPISEFTSDDNANIEDIVKIGDTIEAFITRVNDVEGMIMLSKKRLDAIKNWDIIMAAKESREVVQGYVIQENRGGVVVNVKGVHVFVPASQTGLPKEAAMSELLKKNVKLRINEVNQSKRRVIGSIRDAQKDERRERSEKLWKDIAVGNVYDGVVKSMTTYGVFVDIGGVDGMIHISELSWTRIKQPSEVLSVGDEISVYVISFDKDNRKISLGYKKSEDNPWTKFTSDYSVDDVINVKIVKMMPFGAFAEICPGVDGLIHISQIAEHRVGLPSEVLKDGQLVDVKITEIDNDRQKVSLSIRALLEPSVTPISDESDTSDEEEVD